MRWLCLFRLVLTLMLMVKAGPCALADEGTRRVRQPAAAEGPLDADMARLRVHLLNVAENSQSHRYLTAGVFFGVTGLFAGATIANYQLLTGEPQRLALGVLGIAGGLSFLGGVFCLFLSTDYEDKPRAFLRSSSDASAVRLKAGEALLSGLAARAHAARQLTGGFLAALGVADVAWHFSLGATPSTNYLVYKGALLGALGIAFLITRWPVEVEFEHYQEERAGRDASPVTEFRWDLKPIENGAIATLGLHF